jgi:hypothetical protein
MPRPNRVTPFGDLVAVPERGLVYGNRGCLHDEHGRIRRRYAGRRWIACRLRFRGWHRAPLLQPGRFTELFFLDEATAFAAGHRPCALCRSADFRRFVEIWAAQHPGETKVDAIDRRLHAERLDDSRRAARTHRTPYSDLPDGAMAVVDSEAWLVLADGLWRWSAGGYTERIRRPTGTAEVLTPPSLLAVLGTGWSGEVPLLHPSAASSYPDRRPIR